MHLLQTLLICYSYMYNSSRLSVNKKDIYSLILLIVLIKMNVNIQIHKFKKF